MQNRFFEENLRSKLVDVKTIAVRSINTKTVDQTVYNESEKQFIFRKNLDRRENLQDLDVLYKIIRYCYRMSTYFSDIFWAATVQI